MFPAMRSIAATETNGKEKLLVRYNIVEVCGVFVFLLKRAKDGS